MAATPKHRRSARKARTTRASQRYDVVLAKYRKMKKKGGSTVTISKDTGKVTLPHRVTKESNIYKGVKILEDNK